MSRWIEQCPDGTILRGEFPSFVLPPEGTIAATYTLPGRDYFDWIHGLEQKETKKNRPESGFALFVAGKRNNRDALMDIDFLAERWDIPWQMVKGWIENGSVSCCYYPMARVIPDEATTVKYWYKIGVPLAEILHIEEKYPDLKEIAKEQLQRREKREEKRREEEDRKREEERRILLAACRKKKIPVQLAAEIIENISLEDHQLLLSRQSVLEEKDARIADLQSQLAAAKGEPVETGNADSSRWAASTTAVCRAVIEVCRSGRTDWVSGKDTPGGKDSTGCETFAALLSRLYEGPLSVLSQAERAAWTVLANEKLTWTGGRKPTK